MTIATKFRVLVVEDDAAMLDWLLIALHSDRLEARGARDGSRAAALLDSWEPDVVVTDLRLPDTDGLALLTRARKSGYPPEVIVLTGHASVSQAVKAMQGGAHTFLEKPVAPEALMAMVERALEHRALRVENRRLKRAARAASVDHRDHRAGSIDEGDARHGGPGRAQRCQQPDPVRTGPAKSWSPTPSMRKRARAGAVHQDQLRGHPGRSDGVGALRLHRKGAFTGAFNDKVGLFEMANGGSLLLDEIGEMPSYLQTKLLRVLQEREYRPVGSDRAVRVDFRLICATNVDVDAAMRTGQLRHDLYFRINTITLRVPPLRERTDDIPLLVTHFLEKFRKRYEPQVSRRRKRRSADARYRWPGNVRELENAIERAVL